jgi:DNA-binding LacI/PurR family transcriptional regulator
MKKDTGATTIQDLADRLGLSKATVSRALNGSPLISDETRRRVEDAARALNFTRNVSAQRLSRGASRTVAFVTHLNSGPSQAADLFGWEIMGGVAQGLQKLGYELLVKPVDYRNYSWVRELLDSGQVDGFVLMASTRKAHHVKALIAENAPFVSWGEAAPRSQYPSVSSDSRGGGLLAGRHLAALNKRPLGLIAGPEAEIEVQNRTAGFLEALDEAGVAFDTGYLRYGDYSEASGAAAMTELLALPLPPRAVFVQSDLMAVGALKAAKDAGTAIPRDLAIVGFDGLLISAYTDPPLTTVSQHTAEAGTALAQALVRYLETGQVSHVVMPVELVRRSST